MIQLQILTLGTFALSALLVVAADSCDENFPISKTKYGDVRGTVMKSRKGRSFAAFRGIPYAEPPVGSLRFQAPKDIGRWNGVRNATKDAPICIQQNFLFKRNPPIEGDEDCLYINVYSPKALCQTRKAGKLLPVMVFIHYGAFMAGNSRSDIIGPDYIMDKDVLMVTFNYRLGIMGFLSTYDDEASGNWAFKDQVAALKWVRNNIHYFGGNGKKVTIVGQSAGAGSVHHLLLSPSAKGLFQSAISMSGSALALWAKPQRKEFFYVVTNITGLLAGCDTTNSKVLVECLRSKPASDLVNITNSLRVFKSEPLNPYFAAIETKTERNPEPFITEDPVDIISRGEFHNVPWIIGGVAGEGILRAAPFIRQEDQLAKINANFDDNFKLMLALQLSVQPDMIDSVWSQVKSYYFNGKTKLDPADQASVTGLINLYTDRGFLYPTYQTIQLHKRMGHEHIFVYNFNYKGKYTYGDLFAATSKNINYEWGVCHCDDLLYLLHSPGHFPNLELPKTDMEVSEIMLEFFLNFVQYRDPTPKHIWGNKQRWEELPNTDVPLTDENIHFLDVSGSFAENVYHLNLTNGFYFDRMQFWQSKPLQENFINATGFS